MISHRVPANPTMLRWARERSGLDVGVLLSRFPALDKWESRELLPTLKQLERYARATLTPVGFLFLPEPPIERVPIPDFRTMADRAIARPSPNLLETIYLCQQRQLWYREHALTQGLRAAEFVGSLAISASVESSATAIRQRLGLDLDARRECGTWEDALRQLISLADASGVMIMCSGVVGNNNYRGLDPEEFRGFALSDPIAPLVFINGADTKSAQMFTLAHELAHLWLGQSALSDASVFDAGTVAVERWCNRVAAELLVPMTSFVSELRPDESADEAKLRLARRFKVSTLVILRRLFDAERITREHFWAAYRAEMARLMSLKKSSGGGDFYLSQAARVSKRFARALVESTLEGRTLYRDAMRMVGVSKTTTFHELGRSLGMPI